MSKKDIQINILLVLVLIWEIIFSVFMLVKENVTLELVNSYTYVFILLFVTGYTFKIAIKTKNKGALLYGALGFSCLVIGNLYFVLLNLVNSLPDKISVGNFSIICCYLFFLSALIELKKDKTDMIKTFFSFVIAIAVIATIACAYAVITNITSIMIVSVVLLDSLCIITSALLFKNKRAKFFAILFFILAALDIIAIINLPYFILVLISAMSSILYLLIAKTLINLKLGDKYE